MRWSGMPKLSHNLCAEGANSLQIFLHGSQHLEDANQMRSDNM